jgi:hypothetical protein
MTDARLGVPVTARGGGALGFLAETVASLANRRLVVPVLLLTTLLTVTNIVIARNVPVDAAIPIPFIAAAAARMLGLVAIAVAILRVLGGSSRPLWMPDGAFWLYGLTILVGIGVAVAARLLVGEYGDRSDPLRALVGDLIVNAVTVPLAAWFAAMAIERPLAWQADRWLRGFGSWLLPLLLWSLLILLPLGRLHAAIDRILVAGASEYFWPLALFDGPLSVVLALLGLALAATAYRHVARG